MKVIVTKNYDEMSAAAAKIISETVKNAPDCVLGLATGSTPAGTYEILAQMYTEGKLDMSGVHSVNLDEYYPLAPENPQSYRYFMNENLFDKVNINKENTYVPDGLATDIDDSCRKYEDIIDSLGGIDLQLLGIGRNGHIGFNEPAAELHAATHVTELAEDTIAANARFFESADQVPTHAVTMGIGSIFKARRILLLASGKGKAQAIAKMLGDKISTECPATLLRLHPDIIVICDEDAASEADI